MVERKIGEIFETADGRLAMCVKSDANTCEKKCIFLHDCDGCKNIQVRGYCTSRKRCDSNSVIFVRVTNTNALERDINTLERLIKEYPYKTMENVLVQLKSRLKEK